MYETIKRIVELNLHLQLKVSYLEIYLNKVRDLLSNTTEEIHIREDDRGNTVIQGSCLIYLVVFILQMCLVI